MHATGETETLPEGTVLICGGGPVGLVLALVLAHHGQKSVVIEQNVEATKYPKMHLVLARTMEIFRQMGIADDMRTRGVARDEPFTVRFSSGMGSDGSLSVWDLPSANEFQKRIESNNDGTMPREAWARIPSDIMEPWLREKCNESSLIDAHFGWGVTDVKEQEAFVDTVVQSRRVDHVKTIRSSYVVGCDGAWSPVRTSVGIALESVPMHRAVALTHFKSRDLVRLHRQGKFWHTFFPTDPKAHNGSVGGAIIAQDGKETWTVHDYLGSNYVPDDVTAEKTIARVLGGMGQPYPITVDKVTASSIYTPTVGLAKTWSGSSQRVFLAGDACHQTIPSGGYGMNMGLADAWDLGWKLAATIQGWGGPLLLQSYEKERRPVAELMQRWSKVHMMKMMGLSMTVKLDAAVVDAPTDEGAALRGEIDKYLQANDDHNQSFGVEMGYQYESSLAVMNDGSASMPPAPEFVPRNYQPTTFPGFRVPHVYLSDGTAIADKFGSGFTLVEFVDNYGPDTGVATANDFRSAAKKNGMPLKIVRMADESHALKVWAARRVLVRPDGISSWRSNSLDAVPNASQILLQATGWSKS